MADRILVRMVLQNLLGNAWKFTTGQADAAIEVGMTPGTDAHVCCYVRDNGAGFDPAYASKLFQQFQRLHAADEFPGTGIGLATVRRIVERHLGRVWAEGAIDRGATFYFALDAKDIMNAQVASIDTRNGIVAGHVIRVDPAVEQGTVTVDVAIDGDLPKGARPDLSVDGTIELERLDNVIYVGRPAFGQENNTVGIFKLVGGTSEAVRTPVKLGRSSVNTIEILSGLEPGDQVILSDTSSMDAHERIRLN